MKALGLAICLFIHFSLVSKPFEPAPSFFQIPRETPLMSLDTKQDILVASYGAIADDSLDDIQGISNAIEAAIALSSSSNPVKVVFEDGIYDINPATSSTHSITFSGAKYLLLEGNGAEIIIHNPEVGFMAMTSCENVIVENLSIDYDPIPFTQGIVVAKNREEKTFDITIDEGFPLLSESYFDRATQKYGMIKYPDGKLKEKVTNYFPYTGATHISGNTFRMSQSTVDYIDQIDLGDYFMQMARNNGKTIFQSMAGKNITYKDLNIYASPSGTFNVFNHYAWNIINCNIIPKAGRIQSVNADCIHISGSYIGPWVEDCTFEAVADDALNMKYQYREIVSVESPTLLTVRYYVMADDEFIFYNPREGVPIDTTTITNVTNKGGGLFQVTLASPVEGLIAGAHQTADKIYLGNMQTESFVFRNTTIRNIRRYGMFVQNAFGVIENCTIEDVSGCGIRIENGVDWSEGFMAHDILIQNNTLTNCGFEDDYIDDPTSAAISVRATKLIMPCETSKSWCGRETAEWQGMKNIWIKDNTITYNKKAISVQNTNTAEISGNRLVHNPEDITLGDDESPLAIELYNNSNISESNNTITDSTSTSYGAIQKTALRIFPNPNNGHFNIKLSQLEDHISIIIRDTKATIINKQTYSQTDFIQTQLPSQQGIYIIEVQCNGNLHEFYKLIRL